MMKPVATWLGALALLTSVGVHAADVGVSVQISQPGVYGRIDIGRFPQPAVIVPQPVIITPPGAIVVQPQPVYLWVPPGHRKNWKRHCDKYNACGVPVYFVRHDWYASHVRYGAGPGEGRGDRDRDRDHDRSPGNGGGHGHGRDKDRGRH